MQNYYNFIYVAYFCKKIYPFVNWGLKDMEFRTIVETGMTDIRILPENKISLLGSCFADHIGGRMLRAGLDAHVNPFGVLYNPVSISAMCSAMASDEAFPEDTFFESNGLWHSWLNDSSFSADSKEECSRRLSSVCRAERERLADLDFLFITLGTNRYYELKENPKVVGNCHKQPGKLFTEQQLTVEAASEVLAAALEKLWAVNPSLKIIFTVSPYRYAKYGFHGSQLGKSVLLLAADALCSRYGSLCSYFPAYEIVQDELRDYRFYAADMLHPSEMAVEYIWERFSESCFPPETRAFIAEWGAVVKALSHRPLHPESAAYQDFLRQTMLKLERLIEKYPKLACTPEHDKLQELLKYR